MTAIAILEDAFAVQEAGAFAVVLESIPSAVAAEITRKIAYSNHRNRRGNTL